MSGGDGKRCALLVCPRSFLVLSLFLLCRGAVPVAAHTWTVAPNKDDGHLTLQEGLDIAAPGDVIELIPGRYDEWSLRVIGWERRMIAVLEGSGVTIRGQDREATIIGPPVPHVRRSDDPIGIQVAFGVENVTIENLTIENLRDGLVPLGSIVVKNVVVRNCKTGINIQGARDVLIRNSTFVENYDGIFSYESSGITVRECTFQRNTAGTYFSHWSSDVEVSNCTVDGGVVGFHFYKGSSGTIRNCDIGNFLNYGVVALLGTEVELRDNVIHDGGSSVAAERGSFVYGSGNAFRASGYSTLTFSSGATAQLWKNHISITSPEPAVWLRFYNEPDYPFIVDLRHNYWHTTDSEFVADRIWDSSDQEDLYGTVWYLPMEAGPVPTESITFGHLKATFAGRGQ